MTNDPILKREAELLDAMFTNDVNALNDLLDDDLIFTGLGGVVIGKQEDLNAHRERRLRLVRSEPSEQRITRCGPTAIVSVQIDMEGTYDGAPFNGRFRYTRVWCKRGDRWRMVSGHMSVVEA